MPRRKKTKRIVPKKGMFHVLRKKLFRGSVGLGVVLVLAIVFMMGFLLVGGVDPKVEAPTGDAIDGSIITGTPIPSHQNLQLDTFQLKQCGTDVAIDFLIDNSGSMAYQNKESNLVNALERFGSYFPSQGIIGLQTFSGDVNNDQLIFRQWIPIALFSQEKQQFLSAIQQFNPNGGTPTKDAFLAVKPILEAGKKQYPQKKLALVFISDGIPETGRNNERYSSSTSYICPNSSLTSTNPICVQAYKDTPANTQPQGCRCFDNSEDPTTVAQQIKNEGIQIFTIVYLADEEDKFKPPLSKMMQTVASYPSSPYYNIAPVTNQIDEIIKTITVKVCQ